MKGRLTLGIDIGGTSTDLALVDIQAGLVIGTAKGATARHDASQGLAQLIASFAPTLDEHRDRIVSVHLATTAATNALATQTLPPVGLILIGVAEEDLSKSAAWRAVNCHRRLVVGGGHTRLGEEAATFDEAGLRESLASWEGQVRGVAIASLFSHRNNAHELLARAVVEELLSVPAVCSHQIVRATGLARRSDAALKNAALIPMISELIARCKLCLTRAGIDSPLYVVRGDGTLISSDWAIKNPIETILSGPAASLRGFVFLASQVGLFRELKHMYAYDIGGTTTDIGEIRNGEPVYFTHGAADAPFGVAAARLTSEALGGDSLVTSLADGMPSIGTQSVTPISLIARELPEIAVLLQSAGDHHSVTARGDVRIAALAPDVASGEERTSGQEYLVELLRRSPRYLCEIEPLLLSGLQLPFDQLIASGAIRIAGFTVTDALVCLGLSDVGDRDAARSCASLMAPDGNASRWSDSVLLAARRRLTENIVRRLLIDDGCSPADATASRLIGAICSPEDCQLSNLRVGISPSLGRMGAPSGLIKPHLASVTVPNYEVAGAIGAAASPLLLRVIAEAERLSKGRGYRVFTPWGEADISSFEGCRDCIE